jgi:predicted alpha/beta hydrolase
MSGETRRRRRKWIVWLLVAVVLGLLVKFILHLVLPRNFAGTGEKLPLAISGPPFETLYYCGQAKPRGIVILGTGDGGWSYWEENTAKHLMAQGFAVGGWDCRKFADTRTYGQTELEEGFNAAVEAVSERTHAADDTPIWYGGWSTGAEQSVAAATSPNRPENLVGLLLAAPGTRARYGITTGDLLGANPTGPDTFALEDMAKKLSGIAVAQFAAGLDPMDDTDWIETLSIPHRIFELPGKPHDMGGAGPDFQAKLDEAIAWTLETRR